MTFFRLVLAAMREIFEESAYQRFCAREDVPPGRDAYMRFMRELNESKASKLKCC